MASGYKVAVVGATGAVGTELIRILEERNFPVGELVPMASKSSKGMRVEFNAEDIPVRMLDKEAFKGVEIGFFTTGAPVSKEYAPLMVKEGCTVIDNSLCFNLEKDVPLIVPEVNPHRIREHKGIIANPSCATIQMAVVLYPIHKVAKIKRIVVSSFQSVSGSGNKAVNELSEQVKALFNFREPEIRVYPYQIAFNCLPHIDEFRENGYTQDEIQIALETKRILEDESLKVCATSVRVPVFYGHSASVNIETEKKITPDKVRKILSKAPGVAVEDDPKKNLYPVAIYAVGKDESFVGRIREDMSLDNGIVMWIVSDNLRKGTALNAVQIAECLISP